MQKAIINLETLVCPSCSQKIENALKALSGIDKDSVKVLFNASKAKFDFDESKTSVAEAQKAITSLGYVVIKAQVKDF